MKNSDKNFQLLSTVIITFFICILLLNFNYKSVESQSSSTFLTLTGSNFQDIENSERLQLKEFTLSTWFKTDKQDYLEPATIVNKGGMNDDAPGNNMNYGIWITPEELLQGGFETETGTNIFVTSKQKFNDGNWHNVILSNDGLFLRLYVDGIEIAKTSTLGAIPDMTGLQPIRIGANSLDLDKFFTGDIDEVILWDRALSSDEIFNFYNYDEIPSNGRVIYLPFSSISPTQTAYKHQPFNTYDGTEKDEIEEESFRLSNFSLGTWFRADRIDHNEAGILLNKGGFISELKGENLNFGIWLNPSETIEGGFETQSGTNVFVSSEGKYNDGLWHYVLLTYDGKVLRLYIDGVMVDSKITSGVIPDNTGDQKFVIGGDSSVDDRFFKGDLDEIRVWDRILSTEEVSNGFKNNVFNTTGQIFYQPFSDSDSDAPDTQAPDTQAPDTLTQPPTQAPDTQAPDTQAPDTQAPDTLTQPPTQAPDTQAPDTQAPDTLTQPPTQAPDTQAPDTQAPDTQAPDTQAPDTLTQPPTQAPDTQAPDTLTQPPTQAPDTLTQPPTQAPDTLTQPPTQAPDTLTQPPTQAPDTLTQPPTQAPDTLTQPPTQAPDTLTQPPTQAPDTLTQPPTQAPDTLTQPPTQAPDTLTQPIIDNLTGFLLLKTDVINDNNGTKQASNFTINILGTQASPSSFKAAQSPLAQLVEVGQGQYSVQVEGIEGYDVQFEDGCSAFTILNNITLCTITLNDQTTIPDQQCPPGQHPAASQQLNQTTQQCIPDPQSINNATGFLILRTNVINDNGGTKQASDFTINILGTQASPSSLKAEQSPLAQVIALKEGQYFVQIVGIEGYDVQFKNECAGFTILNNTKVCTITLNDLTQQPTETPGTQTPPPTTTTPPPTTTTPPPTTTTPPPTTTTPPPTTTTPPPTTTTPPPTTTTPPPTTTTPPPTTTTPPPTTTTPPPTTTTPPPTTTTPPPTGNSFVPFNFAAAGDWGCNSNTDKSIQSILSKNSELVLGLGDYSYESNADCWLETISPINDKMKISIGNHDSDEEEGPEITVQFLDHFNLEKQYYSFNKGNVFFLVMSTQVSYSENSEQFNFVKQELEKASNDPNIDWIVVYYHKPMYASSSKHAGLTSLRDIYHPLFDQYKVDLVLAGHNHNYQRSFPLQFNEGDSDNPIVVNKNPNTYNDVGFPIFVTSGTGGVSLHSLGTQPEFNAKQFGKFGHLNVNVTRDTSNHLVGTFYDLTGNKLDEFTITKSLTSLPASPSSSSTTITATSTTGNSGTDKFGIKQIYPTKPGGEEWFMNMDDINADPRIEIKGNIQDIRKNPDGSWTPIIGDKVRLIAYTSDSKGKFDKNDMPTYNLKELAAKGHWYNENDWKNIEMGGYFKLNSADDLGLGYSFSSRSIDDTSNHGGCGGATPKFNVGFDGEIKAKKELWHLSLIDSPGIIDEDLSPSIVGKWIGIKNIIYNLPGDQGVKQEFWIDKTNDGNWEKVYEFADQGGFGERGNKGPEKCGGTWDQLYTWGSPKNVFQWDQSDVAFKSLSVREIIPPSQ